MSLTAAGVRGRGLVEVLAHLGRIAEAQVAPDFSSSFGFRNRSLCTRPDYAQGSPR